MSDIENAAIDAKEKLTKEVMGHKCDHGPSFMDNLEI
jgi:hypothetical protein